MIFRNWEIWDNSEISRVVFMPNYVQIILLFVYFWFSQDVSNIQTTKLSILRRFYFHDVLEQLKTNFQTNSRFKRALGFCWISKLLRDTTFTWVTSCYFSSVWDNFKNRCFLVSGFVLVFLCSHTKKNWIQFSFETLSIMLWSRAVMYDDLILVKAMWPRINQWQSLFSWAKARNITIHFV